MTSARSSLTKSGRSRITWFNDPRPRPRRRRRSTRPGRAARSARAGVRADVDGEEAVFGQARTRLEPAVDQRRLELFPAALARGGREPLVRRGLKRVVIEARQHLEPAHHAALEIEDRLEDRPDALGFGEDRLQGDGPLRYGERGCHL